jgi:dihydroorotase-like cyclic amidohydrolase
MRVDLALCNGTVVTEQGVGRVDVGVHDGRIVALADPTIEPLRAAERIDLTGLHLLPGGIDPHVHLGDQDQSEFEDFATGTASCAAGGLTTVIDMPLNLPPTIDAATLQARREALAPKAHVDWGLWGGLVPGNLGHLEPMAAAGALGFKAFVCEAVDWFPVDDGDLLEGMQEAARLDRPVGVHCENDGIVARLRGRLRAAGRTDIRAHAGGRPSLAARSGGFGRNAEAACAAVADRRTGNCAPAGCTEHDHVHAGWGHFGPERHCCRVPVVPSGGGKAVSHGGIRGDGRDRVSAFARR